MIIKLLNRLLKKYLWCYERDCGDRGFVLAKTREEAIEKLSEYYNDARERIGKTDKERWIDSDWMYLLDTNQIEIHRDIYVNVPW